MTIESKKPSEILRPLYNAAWPYSNEIQIAYSDARYAIDDSHHSRLTALEAAMATLTPPKPAADDGVEFKGIGDDVTIGDYVRLGGRVKLGNDVTIGDGVTINESPVYLWPRGGQFPVYVSDADKRLVGIGCCVLEIGEWFNGTGAGLASEYAVEDTRVYEDGLRAVAMMMGWEVPARAAGTGGGT